MEMRRAWKNWVATFPSRLRLRGRRELGRLSTEGASDQGNPREPLRFEVVDDPKLVASYFRRLQVHLDKYLRQQGANNFGKAPEVTLRTGQLPGRESFLYLKDWDDFGYLIECAPRGWIVSEADYIVHEQRFLRRRESWEAVTLLQSGGPDDLMIRFSSSRHSDDWLSFPIYLDLLVRELPILRRFITQVDSSAIDGAAESLAEFLR